MMSPIAPYVTAAKVLFAVLLTLTLTLCACISSEEAGTAKKVGAPVASQTISDSVRAKVDSLMRADSARAKRAGFTSQHDTLVASVVKTSKSSSRSIKPIERPANTAYTVQVGAFARTQHALQTQKLARERCGELPIFNYFEPYDKLYRIRVGKFDTRQQADSLRKWMIKQFPSDYTDSWINYISK
jgi:cell division septation protein DedD